MWTISIFSTCQTYAIVYFETLNVVLGWNVADVKFVLDFGIRRQSNFLMSDFNKLFTKSWNDNNMNFSSDTKERENKERVIDKYK